MRKVIAVCVSCIVIGASLWLIDIFQSKELISAEDHHLSAEDWLFKGKDHYKSQKYREALHAFQKAQQDLYSLTLAQRQELKKYSMLTNMEFEKTHPVAKGFVNHYGHQASVHDSVQKKSSQKRLALEFLNDARRSLQQGDLKKSIEFAERAATFQVAWAPNEESPQSFLNKLHQQSQTSLSQANQYHQPAQPYSAQQSASFSPVNTQGSHSKSMDQWNSPNQWNTQQGQINAGQTSPQKVYDLMNKAYAAHRQGNLLQAQQFASQANQMASAIKMTFPAYGVESPAQFLARINSSQSQIQLLGFDQQPNQNKSGLNSSTSGYQSQSRTPKQEALSLLQMAREDMRQGDFDQARVKALEAKRISNQANLTWSLFDDRPEIVLGEIDRKTDTRLITGQTSPVNNFGQGVSSSNAEDEAKILMNLAQMDLQEGRLDQAYQKALEADRLVNNHQLADRSPAQLLAQINNLRDEQQARLNSNLSQNTFPAKSDQSGFDSTGNDFQRVPQYQDYTSQNRSAEFEKPSSPQDFNSQSRTNSFSENRFSPSMPVIHPDGSSALKLFNQGMQLLKRGDRGKAYLAFLEAYQSGDRLDPIRFQQLQDFLRDLAPKKSDSIKFAGSNEFVTHPLLPPGQEQPRDQMSLVQQQHALKIDQLRTDVMNAIFRSEEARKKNPDVSLEILDKMIIEVTKADLPKQIIDPFVTQLKRERSIIEADKARREPLIAQERRNQEVRDKIEKRRQYELTIDQELVDLTEEFNELMRQQRYAEAVVIADQAKQLAPDKDIAQLMYWKARFAHRIDRYEQIQLQKEDRFVKAMHDVDLGSIPWDESNLIEFPKDWAAIKERRKGFDSPGNRKRTEEERRIEKSLEKTINLHFNQRPLNEVMEQVHKMVGINIVIDKKALNQEGVPSNTPVTMDVDGIMLKSALNLMLQNLNLDYMIDNEVLKITSPINAQGTQFTDTYHVGDLVTPIPNFQGSTGNELSSDQINSQALPYYPGSTGIGGFQGTGAHYQVDDPIGGLNGNLPPVDTSGSQFPAWMDGAGRVVPRAPRHDSHVANFNHLIDLIVSTVSPESWAEVGGNSSIKQHETTLSLVIRATQKVHEQIKDLLEQLRRLQDLQVTIEVRFVTVTDRFFERIGIDFDFNIEDSVVNEFLPPGTQGNFDPANIPKNGSVVGLAQPGVFTQDLDIGFNQGSFEIGVPDFGNFNPQSGIQMGLAIIDDIEAFFFIQAAQGDERSNLMFAPKVTLFNGQTATVSDTVSRPFVTSLQPQVGAFTVGFAPVITTLNEGVQMTVQAVISADRRFVRLTVIPLFQNITDVFTFTFAGGGGGGGGAGGGGLGGGGLTGATGLGGGLTGGIVGAAGLTGAGLAGFGGGGLGGGGLAGGLAGLAGGGLGGLGLVGLAGIGGGVDGTTGGGGLLGLLGLTGAGNGLDGGGGGAAAGTSITLQQPVFEQVRVTTTVSVPDGGTVLLGGIKRLKEGRNMAGVPILNKIPYVSRLFKNTGVGRETDSLMLMVTPRIIIQEEEEELLGI